MRINVNRKPSDFRDMDTPETAAFYNRVIGRDALFNHIARNILRRTEQRGEVLDVGCGPGHLLTALGRLDSELMLNGLDISPNMLAVAEKNLKARLPERPVTLHQGSMYEMPLEDGRFDLVVNSSVIHMSDTLVPFFNEIYRVLKPGGAGAVVGFRRDQPAWAWKASQANSSWYRYRRRPLDGFLPVLQSSYTADELRSVLMQSTVSNFDVLNGHYLLYSIINKAAE